MQALLLRFLETGEIQSVGAHQASQARQRAGRSPRPTATCPSACRPASSARTCSTGSASSTSTCRRCASGATTSRCSIEHLLKRSRPRRLSISDEAMQVLQRYRWPGNVRELQNVVEQAMWFAEREMIDVGHLPAHACARRARTLLPIARAPAAGRRRSLRRARVGRLFLLGAHPPDVPARATSPATTCASWSCAACARRTATTARCCACSASRTQDYKRFHNFLMTHGCKVDYRAFRQGTPEPARTPRVLLPPLRPVVPPAEAEQPPAGEAIDSSR